MAKITKFLRLGLTPELLDETRNEAKRQKVSVSALIRTALQKHLGELNQRRLVASDVEDKPKRASLLDTPVVFWTRAEEETADRVMRIFREEDR